MNVSVSLLPLDIAARLEAFMRDGKTGSVELHVLAGSIRGWKIIESGKVDGIGA